MDFLITNLELFLQNFQFNQFSKDGAVMDSNSSIMSGGSSLINGPRPNPPPMHTKNLLHMAGT
jgi:hypothetical protein